MTDADTSAFLNTFNSLRAIFPLRANKGELQHLVRLYFKALSRFPITAVEAGADAWMLDGTRFPRPAEWIGAIPSMRRIGDLYPLSLEDADEFRRAEKNGWQADPCFCVLCQKAGVTHRFVRFVPLEPEEGGGKALLDGRVVSRGTWIHGEALRRWYEARDAFQILLLSLGKAKTIPRAPKKHTRAEFDALMAPEYAAARDKEAAERAGEQAPDADVAALLED